MKPVEIQPLDCYPRETHLPLCCYVGVYLHLLSDLCFDFLEKKVGVEINLHSKYPSHLQTDYFIYTFIFKKSLMLLKQLQHILCEKDLIL